MRRSDDAIERSNEPSRPRSFSWWCTSAPVSTSVLFVLYFIYRLSSSFKWVNIRREGPTGWQLQLLLLDCTVSWGVHTPDIISNITYACARVFVITDCDERSACGFKGHSWPTQCCLKTQARREAFKYNNYRNYSFVFIISYWQSSVGIMFIIFYLPDAEGMKYWGSPAALPTPSADCEETAVS